MTVLRALAWTALVATTACNTTAPGASPAPSSDPSAAATSAPVSVIPSSAAVQWIKAESARPAPPESLPLVTVNKADLLVGTESVAKVMPGPLGFEAAIKRAGNRNALQVLPLDNVLRTLHAAAPANDTIRFLFDATTTYRSALEVMFTASQVGFTSFELLVASASGTRSVPASTPKSRADRAAAHAPGAAPPASFILTSDGLQLSVAGVSIGAGCTKGGAGNAVAGAPGQIDAKELASCASRLATLAPEWAGMRIAEVSVSPGLDMQAVLAVVAAIVPALPTVHFGMLSG